MAIRRPDRLGRRAEAECKPLRAERDDKKLNMRFMRLEGRLVVTWGRDAFMLQLCKDDVGEPSAVEVRTP